MRTNRQHLGLAVSLVTCVMWFGAAAAHAGEPAACLSSNPADWPSPAKPYFLVIADTSDSMSSAVSTDNGCMYANTRAGHLACALSLSFKNLAGYAHFGLMTYAAKPSGCSGLCFDNCTYSGFAGEDTAPGCGPETAPTNSDSTTRHGGNLLVPIVPQAEGPSNLADLLVWTNGDCGGSKELFAWGGSPINGALRDAFRYFSNQWASPEGSPIFPTPLGTPSDLPCRRLNVILIVDGPESCDKWADVVDAATDLHTGFTIGGQLRTVNVYVVRFGNGLSAADANTLAAAGGTGSAHLVANDANLRTVMNSIVLEQVGVAESCDNSDNNCNGCTDEGYRHYGNVQSVAGNCCSWSTLALRNTCLANYLASITLSLPKGDQKLLPCTNAAQASDPATWLCFDPGENCDNVDNNLQSGVDEGLLKCGFPAQCPSPEVCDGQDNDCDGQIDEGGLCPTCVPSPEVCDGCDNDCDGVADDGVASLPCGLPIPANCLGTLSCKPAQPVASAGACIFMGGGWNSCTNNPQTEVCDSIDNDCDGIVDDSVPPVSCVPSGTPPGLVYGSASQCKMGSKTCGSNSCVGFVGPSAEVCDGIDNDCDGISDEGAPGVGLPCGLSQPPCTLGSTACVNGSLICHGGKGPQAEICDGIDNNCNGVIDDAPLSDAPPAGMNGCWDMPGNCCSFSNVNWCPPPGASCNGVGMLAPPCSKGTLVCTGSAGWKCTGAKAPLPELCNGLDDDCSGIADDGLLPGSGGTCGTDAGDCKAGTWQCKEGKLACDWVVPPYPEVCDGSDNDCDDVIDNIIQYATPCVGQYDMMLYPGERSLGSCRMGVLVCDPLLGITCIQAVTPQPEICDGVDNDCDGQVDEAGVAPDGTDGSAVAGGDTVIGEQCYSSVGVCPDTYWSCSAGKASCQVQSGAEVCDGLDNDCDGFVDEEPGQGEPILCGAGSLCVRHGEVVRCSQPCTQAAQPCPGGQRCVDVSASSDGTALPKGCLPRSLLEAPGVDPLGSGVAQTMPLQPGVPLHHAAAGRHKRGSMQTQLKAPTLGGSMASVQHSVVRPTLPEGGGTTETQEAALEFEGPVHTAVSQEEPAGGCTAGNTSNSGSAVLLLTVLAALAVLGLRYRRRWVNMGSSFPILSLLLLCAVGGATACTVETSTGPGADIHDTAAPDSAQDAALPDSAPVDMVKPKDQWADGDMPDVLPDVVKDVMADSDGSADGLDTNPGDGNGCGDADLMSPSTCGSCGHNCLDEVPPNADGNAAVCQWEVGSQEPGVCLFPVCLPGWANPDPTLPGCEFFCTSTQIPETVCNNVDDDCDHDVDEEVDGCAVATCGGCDGMNCATEYTDVVACETYTASCLDALCLIKTCQPGHVDLDGKVENGCEYPCGGLLETEEFCDGQDDDCNGEIDEGFDFSSPFHCGGCNVNCYEAAPNAAVDGVACAWSGNSDEPGTCSFAACAVNYHDLDPTAPGCEVYCVKQADTDVTCDAIDDDCDGWVDEDVDYCGLEHCGDCSTTCEPGQNVEQIACVATQLGACASGAQCGIATCIEGYVDLDGDPVTGCEYACVKAGAEMCNGLDDNCNGEIDEDLSADPAMWTPCYGGSKGLCASPERAGTLDCIAGNLECVGESLLMPGQLAELCNGLDDDCDGVVDLNPTDIGVACGSSTIFPCSLGTQQCVNGNKVCIGAVGPNTETCNGVDDNCDGAVDLTGDVPPTDATGPCNVPLPPPSGATSPCKAGLKACAGGAIQCVGSSGPTSTVDSCGIDSNCDGLLTNQPDLMTSVTNCGSCGNNCYSGSVHAVKACVLGTCSTTGCEQGYYDLDGNGTCEYACMYISAQESCNGVDDNCNGQIDEGVIAPSPTQVCGVSPSAATPECTSMVQVACQFGVWKCTFAANICVPTCSTANEICDTYDNNCNGQVNENVANWGKPCSSDEGLPSPGHGACRTTGTYVCDGGNAVRCSAVKADCSTLPGGCTELCDGMDNDCDGSVDEPFSAKGTNAANFVKPVVTKVGSSLWMYSYEASRPTATAQTPGFGNGYFTAAPVGSTLDKTPSCSAPNKMPWFNVTPTEASQVCTAMGGRLCTDTEWVFSCLSDAIPPCTWGYNPKGTACTTTYTSSKYCNLAPGFDFNLMAVGDQDGLLATASALLQNCWADWSGAYGNTSSTNKLFDITGNLGEWALVSGNTYAIMGGSYLTDSVDSARCSNSSLTGAGTTSGAAFGFRCCFGADPTL